MTVLLASVSSEVDNKRLQFWSSTKNVDGRGFFTDGLTSWRQLRQLLTTTFTVACMAVNLSTNSLPRLVQAVENDLLLGEQGCCQVVDETLVLLIDMRMRACKHHLHTKLQYFSHTQLSATRLDGTDKLWNALCHFEIFWQAIKCKKVDQNHAVNKHYAMYST